MNDLAIVVPYRDRRDNLAEFVPHMERFLKGLDFRIVVVQQTEGKPFNRGALLNVGFDLVHRSAGWVAFHDVDMLPIDKACDYSYPASGMRHLAGAVEQFGFTCPYRNYLGGVLVSTISAFESINGFSNLFWGWGSEDDDLFLRVVAAGVSLERAPGKFRSLPHARSQVSADNNDRLAKTVQQALAWNRQVTNQDLRWLRRTDWESITVKDPSSISQDGLTSLTYRLLDSSPLQHFLGTRLITNQRHGLLSVQI